MAVALVALGATGCASRERTAAPTTGASRANGAAAERPAPSFEAIAARYNERTARLGQVWASAVVRLEYVDEDGDLRREQGEGHLQFIAPTRLALSVGKLSETIFWLGCDAERYWWFDLSERDEAVVGRHENVGRPCSQNVGLPAHPLDIIELLGVSPLYASQPGEARVGWSTDGKWIVVETPARLGVKHVFLDPTTYEPAWIKLYADRDGQPIVFAELTNYQNVNVRGVGGYFPRMASRISIRRPADEGEIRLTLASMSDGSDREDRLNADAFRFEALQQAFRPQALVVADENCR